MPSFLNIHRSNRDGNGVGFFCCILRLQLKQSLSLHLISALKSARKAGHHSGSCFLFLKLTHARAGAVVNHLKSVVTVKSEVTNRR